MTMKFPKRPGQTITGAVTCDLDGTGALGDNVRLVDEAGTKVEADVATKSIKTIDQNPTLGFNVGRGAYEMLPNAPDDIQEGFEDVAVAGTAEQLNGGTPLVIERGVLIKAKSANGGLIFIGSSTVDLNNGVELNPNESVFIPTNDVSKIYIDTDNNGDGVKWTAS